MGIQSTHGTSDQAAFLVTSSRAVRSSHGIVRVNESTRLKIHRWRNDAHDIHCPSSSDRNVVNLRLDLSGDAGVVATLPTRDQGSNERQEARSKRKEELQITANWDSGEAHGRLTWQLSQIISAT
jgi:hypothetical protein